MSVQIAVYMNLLLVINYTHIDAFLAGINVHDSRNIVYMYHKLATAKGLLAGHAAPMKS